MKKTILGAITLVTLLVLGACGSSSADTASSGASDATEIKVGTGNEALPYAYLDENGEYDGYDVAVVKAIDEKNYLIIPLPLKERISQRRYQI